MRILTTLMIGFGLFTNTVLYGSMGVRQVKQTLGLGHNSRPRSLEFAEKQPEDYCCGLRHWH